MRIENIKMSPFEFRSITDYESAIEVNEHGYAKVTGLVNSEQKDKAMSMLLDEVWGSIIGTDQNGNSLPLFQGVVTNVQVQKKDDTYILTVELKTGTFLMDTKEHIRVYQSGATSYSIVHKNMLANYIEGECLMVEQGIQLEEMVVQYHETDWEFAKRLASRRNTVIFPNEKSKGVKYTFGLKEGAAEKLSSYNSLQIIKNVGQYQYKKQNGIKDAEEIDEIAYMVKSREVFYVGDTVELLGKNYLVEKVSRQWNKKELWNEYTLKSEKGFSQITYYNKKIIGASLKGRVTNISKDKVEIIVPEDENKNNGGRKLFDYATVYSSPDGSGWYCMPEKDDWVQLQFPDEREANAYVSSSVNVEPADSMARSNPDYKSIKNMQGKEILFTPKSLVMTNNKGMTITIDDDEGIKVESDKDIILKAKETIGVISEEQTLQMLAAQQILMQQSNTKLELAETISMSGGQVNMQ